MRNPEKRWERNGIHDPKVSIVTPTLNQGDFIEETIISVLHQTYPNVEYIIVDGGSTDDTVDILEMYKGQIKLIQGQDEGQTDAINIGFDAATGYLVSWLNSDDLLCSGALRAVGKAWKCDPGNLITGIVEDFDESGVQKVFVPSEITKKSFIECYCEGKINNLVWHQPGIFLPLAAVKKLGGVREDVHFTMDRFLMIDLLQDHEVLYISGVLARFRHHDNSKTESSLGRQFGLEFIEKVRSIKEIPWVVSAKNMRKYHVHLLIIGGAAEGLKGNFSCTIIRTMKALSVSPYRTLVEICKLPQALIRRSKRRRKLAK